MALCLGLLGLGGCAVGPETVAPVLEPTPSAPVWPGPPETPRYAFVRTLIGERDFLAPDSDTRDAVDTAFRWIVGLIVGEPTYLELRRPVSGMSDARGRVLIVDSSHKAVVVFDMTAKELLLWPLAAPGIPFASPVGIAGDGRGGFLVSDSEMGEVFRLDAEGRPIARFGKGVLSRPTGIAHDPLAGLVYVADTAAHDIKIFDDGGTLLDTLGGRGDEPGRFNTPTYLTFSDGQLYVADTFNFRIQIFDRSGDDQRQFGQLGLFVGNMTRPKGVAVGGGGRIYVVESYFDHLLVFDAQGQLLLPIGGTGPGVGEFYLPSGAWTDTTGRVFIADMFNGRVVVLKELT